MSNEILNGIKSQYQTLSKKEKLIANYMIDNFEIIGFLGISDLSRKANVSMSTITRFVKNIGFSDFSSFKQSVILLKETNSVDQTNTTFNDINTTLKDTLDQNVASLNRLYNEDLNKNYLSAIEAIKDARHVYVVATRSSYTIAYYLYFMLKDLLENVDLITDGLDDIDGKLSKANRNDTIIAISYKLYTLSTYKVVEHFEKIGSQIIAITDSYTSPVALKANIILEVENNGDILSFAGPLSMANAIVNGINAEDIDFYNNKIKIKQNFLIENDVFMKD